MERQISTIGMCAMHPAPQDAHGVAVSALKEFCEAIIIVKVGATRRGIIVVPGTGVIFFRFRCEGSRRASKKVFLRCCEHQGNTR